MWERVRVQPRDVPWPAMPWNWVGQPINSHKVMLLRSEQRETARLTPLVFTEMKSLSIK